MAEGITGELIWTTLVIGLISFWISSRILSVPTAFLVTTVKILLPFFYFAFFFDGTWTFYDDIYYQYQGERMLELGFNPVTALFTPSGIKALTSLSEGRHIIYGWWNLLGQYFFGEHYYAAVFLNVILTFISGYFIFLLAKFVGFSQTYAKGLLLFFLLHWDVLAWSSFTNLKDIMIMTLTVIAIFLTLRLSKKIDLKDVSALAAVTFCFFWIRFYVPFLMLIATILWLTLYQKGKRRYTLILLSIVSIFVALRTVGSEGIIYYSAQLDVSLVNAFKGMIRMALTPQPWSITPAYSFLFIPSILHWMLFVPALISGWILARKSKEFTFLIIYLLVSLLLYSFYEVLQGTRHRVQVIPVIVWLQFHFLWLMLQVAFKTQTKSYYKRVTRFKNN